MFFKKTRVAVLETAPAAPIVPPTGQRIEKSDFGGVELKEYVAVAEKICFTNGALLAAQLTDFFAEEGINLYEYSKVTSFLTKKAESEGPTENGGKRIWCWKPLRKDDCSKLTNHLATNVNGHISSKQYHGAVPYPVLLTVEKIAKRFGDQVQFYVSDYEANNPDPFLAVTGIGIDWFVTERWDEPNFRS